MYRHIVKGGIALLLGVSLAACSLGTGSSHHATTHSQVKAATSNNRSISSMSTITDRHTASQSHVCPIKEQRNGGTCLAEISGLRFTPQPGHVKVCYTVKNLTNYQITDTTVFFEVFRGNYGHPVGYSNQPLGYPVTKPQTETVPYGTSHWCGSIEVSGSYNITTGALFGPPNADVAHHPYEAGRSNFASRRIG